MTRNPEPITGRMEQVGDYRILYSVHDEIRVMAVISAGHRREVYG